MIILVVVNAAERLQGTTLLSPGPGLEVRLGNGMHFLMRCRGSQTHVN